MSCLKQVEVITILASVPDQIKSGVQHEVIYTIISFEFSANDPNKEEPVSLYLDNGGKGEIYMGAFRTSQQALHLLQKEYKAEFLEIEVKTNA